MEGWMTECVYRQRWIYACQVGKWVDGSGEWVDWYESVWVSRWIACVQDE